MIKLYSWLKETEATPTLHMRVYRDHCRKSTLTVLIPFNFIASAYFYFQNLKWQVEDKLRHPINAKRQAIYKAGLEAGRASRV